jgi:hypothetical protein
MLISATQGIDPAPPPASNATTIARPVAGTTRARRRPRHRGADAWLAWMAVATVLYWAGLAVGLTRRAGPDGLVGPIALAAMRLPIAAVATVALLYAVGLRRRARRASVRPPACGRPGT